MLMVKAQGGDESVIADPSNFGSAKIVREVKAPWDGYIASMDSEGIGVASQILGAGRETLEDTIDYLAGIILNKKTGDKVSKGDIIAWLYILLFGYPHTECFFCLRSEIIRATTRLPSRRHRRITVAGQPGNLTPLPLVMLISSSILFLSPIK